MVARSLNPANTLCPEQIGHPLPPDRLLTAAFHVCPLLHFQPTSLFENITTVAGSHPCACAASSGLVVARSLNPANTFLFEQIGHPLPRDRLSRVAYQVCPSEHFHRVVLPEFATTVVGSHPSACAASSELVVARSLKPTSTTRLAQIGHPLPPDRLLTVAFHVCPLSHFQPAFLSEPCETTVGSHPSACAASSEFVVARSLIPVIGIRPEQTGHPLPFVRLATIEFHQCPNSHSQLTFLFEPAERVVGSHPCACAANSG